jgi:hypothetical protein
VCVCVCVCVLFYNFDSETWGGERERERCENNQSLEILNGFGRLCCIILKVYTCKRVQL